MVIFDNPFFTEMLLPFLLVFVVVFAILQKSKVLANTQVDAIVGLVIGLILIGVPGPRDIVVGIMPWLAVGIAVILVFLATPIAGGPRTLQAVGRVSRAAPGKNKATVVDFVDRRVPALVGAHRARQRMYARA